MQLSIIDNQASSSTQPVEYLTDIFSQASLQPTADTPRTPNKRSPIKFKQRPGPRKHPIAVGVRWVPLPVVTPSRARKCRSVEFKLRVLSWAEHWGWMVEMVGNGNLYARRYNYDLGSSKGIWS